jgi:hypothetical protein
MTSATEDGKKIAAIMEKLPKQKPRQKTKNICIKPLLNP